MKYLRRTVIMALIVAIDVFAVWVNFQKGPAQSAVLSGFIIVVFTLQPFGALWMLYDCFRYERKPWPYAILAFVPYVFVWHYFERVRKRGPAERTAVARRRNEGHSQAD